MKRLLFIPVLCLCLMMMTAQSQWQGVAAYGNSADFPAEGYYAASSSFPVNSVITVRNSETGKTVRVVVSRQLSDPGLFLALSPAAARELGMESGRTAQVSARQFFMYDLTESLVEDDETPAVARNQASRPSPAAPGASPAPSPVPAGSPTSRPVATPAPVPTAIPAATPVSAADAPAFVPAAAVETGRSAQADSGQPAGTATPKDIRREVQDRRAQDAASLPAEPAATPAPAPTPDAPAFSLADPLVAVSHGPQDADAPAVERTRPETGARASSVADLLANPAGTDPVAETTPPPTIMLPLMANESKAAGLADSPLAKDAIAERNRKTQVEPPRSPVLDPSGAVAGAIMPSPTPVPLDPVATTTIPLMESIPARGSLASGVQSQDFLARKAEPSPGPAVDSLALAPQTGLPASIGALKAQSAGRPQGGPETPGARPGARGLSSGVQGLKGLPSTRQVEAVDKTPEKAEALLAAPEKNSGTKVAKTLPEPTPTPAPALSDSGIVTGLPALASLPETTPAPASPVPAASPAPVATPLPLSSGVAAGIKGYKRPGQEIPNPGEDVLRADAPLDQHLDATAKDAGQVAVTPRQPQLRVETLPDRKAQKADAALDAPDGPAQDTIELKRMPQARVAGTESPEASLEQPASGLATGIKAGLQETRLPQEVKADPALAGLDKVSGKDFDLAGLPVSRLPAQASADASLAGATAAGSKTATVGGLPESRLPGQAAADASLAGATAAGSKTATVGGLPESRLPGQAAADASLAGATAAGGKTATVGGLPESRLPGQAAADASLAGATAAGGKTATVGGLPESRLPGQAAADASLAGATAAGGKTATVDGLPESRLPGQAAVDPALAGSTAGPGADAAVSGLPESRLPGQAAVDPALAGSTAGPGADAAVSGLPESRLPGQAAVDPALAGSTAGPGADAAVSGLPESRLPGQAAVDPALAGSTAGPGADAAVSGLPESRLPGQAAVDPALAGSTAGPGADAAVSGLPNPGLATGTADSGLRGPGTPETGLVDAALAQVKGSDQQTPEAGVKPVGPAPVEVSIAASDNKPPVLKAPSTDGLAAPARDDKAVSTNLPAATARNPLAADGGLASENRSEGPATAGLGSPQVPPGPEGSVAGASPVEPPAAQLTLAQAQLLASLGQADPALAGAATAGSAKVPADLYRAQDPDRALDPSLATLPGRKDGPVVVDETSPVLGTDKGAAPAVAPAGPATVQAPADASKMPAQAETGKPGAEPPVAAGPVQVVETLEADSWYLQLGSFNNLESARKSLKDSKTVYPFVILAEKVKGKKVYKVYLGPILEDEKGMMLYTFRAKGYKDAFIRKGKEVK